MKVAILKHPSTFWAPCLDLLKKPGILIDQNIESIEFGSLFHKKVHVLGQITFFR
jgi:hypothetical protein